MFPQLHKSVVNTFHKKSFDLMMECVYKSEELCEFSQPTMSPAAAATCSAHSSSQPSASCSQYDGQPVHQQLHSPRAAPQTSYS